MFDIGRVCVKIAGRDSKRKTIIVDVLEKGYVLVDGETRRKKCNIKHLEPLAKTINIAQNASHEEIVRVFKSELGIDLKEKKEKALKEGKKEATQIKKKVAKKAKKEK
jgi:large subunit ribosomal protein L14e